MARSGGLCFVLSLLLVFCISCQKEESVSNESAASAHKASNTVRLEPAAAQPAPAAAAPEAAKEVPPFDKLGPFDVADAIKPDGWKFEKSGGMGMGSLMSTTITASKGGTTAKITLVQPTGKADDPKSSIKITPLAEQLTAFQEAGAAFSDGKSLIAVEITGDKETAKALLETAVTNLKLKKP